MHWRHVSITTTPCWGSRLVALRAHVLLAERIGAHPLSQCAHPGQLGGEACRGLPSECMLGDGARGVPRLTPNTTGAPLLWRHMHMVYLQITFELHLYLIKLMVHSHSSGKSCTLRGYLILTSAYFISNLVRVLGISMSMMARVTLSSGILST